MSLLKKCACGARDENEPKEAVLALVLAQRKPPAEDEPDRQADGG
eukprot:COSAG04_NODE_15872_length_517_cov_10.229665_2_plen_44_part_01